MAIDDTGELIPFAKKMLVSGSGPALPQPQQDSGENLLSRIWPEPNWKALAENHPDIEALLQLKFIYSNIPTTPNLFLKMKGVDQSQMTAGYIEIVSKYSKVNPATITKSAIERAEQYFRQIYSQDNKKYFAISAGLYKAKQIWYFPVLTTENKKRARVLAALGWPKNLKDVSSDLLPIEMYRTHETNGTKMPFFVIGKYNKKSVTYRSGEYRTEEEAIAAIKDILHKEGKWVDSKALEDQENFVEPRKKEFDFSNDVELGLSPDSLIETFGLRAVQFGNSLTEKEKQKFIDNTFYSFAILAQIIGVSEKEIGKGVLGIAFGARGSGNAAAHFESELNVINLTRFNGPGCISHEYMHFIDSFLARKIGLGGLLSDNYLHPIITYSAENVAEFSELVKFVISQREYVGRSSSITSQKKAQKYWSKPCELLARAFEAYVEDVLYINKISCSWLASGTTLNGVLNAGDRFFPYPDGQERKRLFDRFEMFLPLFKQL